MNGAEGVRLRAVVRAALVEDGASEDVTVRWLGIGDEPVSARIECGGEGVVCGTDAIAEAMAFVGKNSIRVDVRVSDGDDVADGDVIASIAGPARAILSAERVVLNTIGRLSGIATLARTCVDAVAGTGVTVLDTRKTTPLWRDLEKYAVRCGGAVNHRRDLAAMVLVKENHRRALGGADALIERLSAKRREKAKVEVEVDSQELLERLRDVRVDRIMLDNFSPDGVVKALEIIDAFDPRPEVEVSGGVTPETIAGYAIDGVNFISVGALTHSAPSLPVSLELEAR